MSNILSERAMLAKLTIRQWSARRLDKAVTREVAVAHNASSDAGRYNKRLIAKDALAAIQTIAGAARTFHYTYTSPWTDEGARILSARAFPAYAQGIRDFREQFEAAVAAFVSGYDQFKADAKVSLNGLFSEEDYPEASQIAERFAFERKIFNVPDASDFRVDLADGQAEDIKAELQATMDDALREVMRDAWQRVADHVGKMAEKLRAYVPGTEGQRATGIFHDSLVENVRELAALLPSLNIARDPALDACAETIKESLCQHDAADLRIWDSTRLRVAESAESILAQVGSYLS